MMRVYRIYCTLIKLTFNHQDRTYILFPMILGILPYLYLNRHWVHTWNKKALKWQCFHLYWYSNECSGFIRIVDIHGHTQVKLNVCHTATSRTQNICINALPQYCCIHSLLAESFTRITLILSIYRCVFYGFVGVLTQSKFVTTYASIRLWKSMAMCCPVTSNMVIGRQLQKEIKVRILKLNILFKNFI